MTSTVHSFPSQAPLLDFLIEHLAVKNDAALCRRLDVAPPIVSKLRSGRCKLSPRSLLKMHVESGVPVDVLSNMVAQ